MIILNNKKNKQGGFVDLFLFMIISFVIVLVCAIFIYISNAVKTEVRDQFDDMTFGGTNGSVIVDETLGKMDASYQALYWISWFLMVGMVISIFIGSYLVTTKPIFFVPYIFILIIAVIVAVGISNAYETVIATPELASIFNKMVGANMIMSKLPIWITAIGIVGAVIMFIGMGSRDQYSSYGGYYG